MRSDAGTVEEYLDGLQPERREVVSAVRDVINEALPDGYEEGIAFGMIGWSVPLKRFSDTYNGQPLSYVGLAAQKRYYSLYLNAVYAGSVDEVEFRRQWEATGRKLHMGKSCVRIHEVGRPRSRLGRRGGGQHINGCVHPAVRADALLAHLSGRRSKPAAQEVIAIADKGRRLGYLDVRDGESGGEFDGL